MLLKKRMIVFLLMLVMLVTAGCAKGEITLDLQQLGQADVSCRLLVAPALALQLEQVKQSFREDQFNVSDIREGEWTGFLAERHFDKVRDVKNIHLFQSDKKTAGESENTTAASTDKKENTTPAEIVTEHGWFVDRYKVDATLHLERQLPVKKEEEKQLAAFLLSQIRLNFVVKLPLEPNSSNAGEVRDGGKTLVWAVNLTSPTRIQAEASVVNWPRVGGVALVAAAVAAALWRRRKVRKKRKEASAS